MKKRLTDFIKTIPVKLYILLAAILAFTFFANDFGLVDIQKTAVILAAAIDKTDDGGFSVTAQIAVPKGVDRTTGGTSSVEIEGKGETVSACFSQIYAKTGWVPKLVFCNLLLLGEKSAKTGVFCCLDFFLRNEYMPDSCYVAISEGKAGELLQTTSAVDDTSSLAIGKLFSDAAEKSGKVMTSSLREFAIGYYGASNSGYLPYVRAVEQSTHPEGSASGGGSSSGGESGGSGGNAEQKEIVYSAEETAMINDGKFVGILNEEETFVFSLLSGNVFAGSFTVPTDEKPTALTVLNDEGSVSLDMKGAPKAKIKTKLRVSTHSRGQPSAIEEIASSKPSEKLERFAKEYIEKTALSLFEKSRAAGCDLFYLKRSLYRSSKKKYSEWKDSLLSALTPEIEVTVKGIH